MKQKPEFTRYAQWQIQERGINQGDVIEVIESPDQLILGKKGRKIAQKRFDRGGQKGLFRVIFEEKDDTKVIVTAYWTSKIEKYWRNV